MFGCFRHHEIRKRRIARAGVRPEWESFEQWERHEEQPAPSGQAAAES